MFKKFAIGISCILTVTAAAALAGCGEVDYDELYADRAKVVFELEGGSYDGRTVSSVSHYYSLLDGGSCTINELDADRLSRDGGFELEGWYKTKTTEGGKTEYSEPWNFDRDTVTAAGVTLYAKWSPPIAYTFEFVYTDDDGNEQTAGSYKVNAGDKFGDVWRNDILTYANGYADHTAVAVYYDAQHTIPFDDSVTHPGGEESCAVKLYVEYIEGTYTIVSTAAQLKLARSKNIYLVADIDMEGAALSFDNFKDKTFIGGGHTVSNFTVNYSVSRNDLVPDFADDTKKALCIAIFGNSENVTVRDVTFENVTVTVDTFLSGIDVIYVAPLAVDSAGSTFENVTVKASFGSTDRTTAEIVFVTDRGTYTNVATETGCRYEITVDDKETE